MRLLPVLAFAVTAAIGTAVTYWFTRYRAAAEVPLALPAAVTLEAWERHLINAEPPQRRTPVTTAP